MDVITSSAFALVVVIPLWRICARAGLTPALALLVFIPVIGIVLVAAILAFARWSGVHARVGGFGGPYQPDLFGGDRR